MLINKEEKKVVDILRNCIEKANTGALFLIIVSQNTTMSMWARFYQILPTGFVVKIISWHITLKRRKLNLV